MIGNKRSGTSLLVRLLNRHPRLFVTHESDIVWLLYCLYHGLPIQHYPDDGFLGAQYTLDQAGHLMSADAAPYEVFLRVQEHLMRSGSPWLPAMNKRRLAWVGDKKPVQQADPMLLSFVVDHFPNARFLHVIRHPRDWLVSRRRFVPQTDQTDEESLGFWLRNEERVVAARRRVEVCSITYRDLCMDPAKSVARVLAFLDLEMPRRLLWRSERIRYKTYADREIQLPEEVERFWALQGEKVER